MQMIKSIKYIFKILCSFLAVKEKKIIVFSNYGAQYGDSPKYISEYIVENDSSYKIVWAFTKPELYTVPGVRKVKYASLSFLYEWATSQFIITNSRLSPDLKKRKNQIYIQTWHSSLRLKKIEKDAEAYLSETYIQQAKADSGQIDYLLAGCRDSKEIFERAFWYKGAIPETGTPRIDVIINPKPEIVKTVKSSLAIDNQKKILLYAPTFRENGNLDIYIKEFDSIKKELKKRFGGEWEVVVRLHPHLYNKSHQIFKDNNIIHATQYPDIQELLVAADFLITDYSSLMFDYLYSEKKVLLYIPDLNEYLMNERELYYDVEELPFLKAYSKKDVEKKISEFNEGDYISGIQKFIKKIGTYEKGNASEQLLKILNKK